MVNVEEFKKKIKESLSEEYKIGFYGDNFDKTIKILTDTQFQEILVWVKTVTDREADEIRRMSNKKYKGIKIRDLIIFRKAIQITGKNYRAMLLKIKNNGYIEFHLGTHKYYDKLRSDLNLR